MMSTTALAVRRFTCAYPGREDAVPRARHDAARCLAGCARTDEALLVLNEIITNAVLHSGSRGEFFSIVVEVHGGYCWVECEDLGGIWHCKAEEDYPHGLGIVDALAGEDNWGIDGDEAGRIVWVRLPFPEGARSDW
jgi:hypothetical protein